MLKQKEYNFDVIFDEIEKFNKNDGICEKLDMSVFNEVDRDIKLLEEYTNLFKEPEYHTYAGT